MTDSNNQRNSNSQTGSTGSNNRPPDALIGKQLGDYTIRSLLGRGGMARVYEGYDDRLERLAAIKVIEIPGEHEEEIKQRFFREARSIAKLDHPNIVTVYQFGESQHVYYLAMKLVDGRTLLAELKKLRQRKKFMEPAVIVKVITQIAAALDYAHSKGIIHRDIKPSNIMLTKEDMSKEDRAILMDFGLTMQSGSDSTLGTAFGTPRYIAPEQAISSQRAGPLSDIYSLGVVMYEMITGQTPFDADSPMSLALSHITNAPPPPRLIRPDLPTSVELVILKALEKKPEHRWKSATAMAEALRKAYDGVMPNVTLMHEDYEPATKVLSRTENKPSSNSNGKQEAEKKDRRRRAKAASPPPLDESLRLDPPTEVKPGLEAALAKPLAGQKVAVPRGAQKLSRAQLAELTPGIIEPKPRHRGRLRSVLLLLILIVVIAGGIAFWFLNRNMASVFAINSTATPPTSFHVRLIYNSDQLVIYNVSGKKISLENLSFVHGTARLDITHFADTTINSYKELPDKQCLRALRPNADKTMMPDVCGAQTAPFTLANNGDAFWTARDANDTVSSFSVKWQDQMVQVCLISTNTCDIEIPNVQ